MKNILLMQCGDCGLYNKVGRNDLDVELDYDYRCADPSVGLITVEITCKCGKEIKEVLQVG